MSRPHLYRLMGSRCAMIRTCDPAIMHELMFGPRPADAHVRAWLQHQFRRSDAGRTMLRNRLRAKYPHLPLAVALAVYSVRDTDSYMELEYI